MRCKGTDIFSTEMFNCLTSKVTTIENLFPTINTSFEISTTTYPIPCIVINNEIITSHRQTIFIFEGCEFFIVSPTIDKVKNVSIPILKSPGSITWSPICSQLKLKFKLSNTTGAIRRNCWS